jgi:hypothetical protein
VTLVNNILWGDTGGEIYKTNGADSAAVSYSDVQGGFSGTGNINTDPNFVDAAGNLHLQPGSPVIDVGTNTGAPTFDLDNNPRPVHGGTGLGTITDMGAYEYQGGRS